MNTREMNYTQKEKCLIIRAQEICCSHHGLLLALGLALLDQQGIGGEGLLENTPLVRKERTDSFSTVLLVHHCGCESFWMFVSLFTSGISLIH